MNKREYNLARLHSVLAALDKACDYHREYRFIESKFQTEYPSQTVTVKKDRLKDFNQQLCILGAFAAEVCETTFEKLCTADLFLAFREYLRKGNRNETHPKEDKEAEHSNGFCTWWIYLRERVERWNGVYLLR